jgi:hypothetical protein
MKDKEKNSSNKKKLSFFEKAKIKLWLFLVRIFGGKKEYAPLKKRLDEAEDMVPSQGASSFGLYGLPDIKYDVVYSQLKIDSKHRYIWIKSVNGGLHYEGGGIIYIHQNFKGTIYAPNACLYIRKSVYGLIEMEKGKVLVRDNNGGYIHCPGGEVQIGGSNYGYIYTHKGSFIILQNDHGISKGNEKELRPEQKELLLGLRADDYKNG